MDGDADSRPRRQMIKAELLGHHTHESESGVRVHVFVRESKYLARGRLNGQMFGETLGTLPRDAEIRLRNMLAELDRGSYVRPSEARRRILGRRVIPKLTFRELCDEFLAEKRKLRGRETASTYCARLAPPLTFADSPSSIKHWPLATNIDREFAIGLKSFLATFLVTPNGRPGSTPRVISPRQTHNSLSTVRTMLAWAVHPQVRMLPVDFVNPFTNEIVGTKPRKDPLRQVLLPIERRIEMIAYMDLWQLTHLGMFLVLPMRPEEACGMLVSDVDWKMCRLHFQTRLRGRDFTKGRTSFQIPFPEALSPLLALCIGERESGPLFRNRASFARVAKTRLKLADADPEKDFEASLACAPPGTVQTEHDAKVLFRSNLRRLGGCSADQLARSFKRLLSATGETKGIRFYDLREAVTTDMKRSRMGHLELTYLTGHACSDILVEYTPMDIDADMQKYFQSIQPLLERITTRFSDIAKGHETIAPCFGAMTEVESHAAPMPS